MNRAIASLAVVKTAWEIYRRDYIENFVPFVATLAKKKHYNEIDPSNLRSFLDDFRTEFGLAIPHHPMLTILDRAKKRGILERKASKLIPVERNILKYDFADIAIKKEAELNKVVSEFIKYCKEIFSVKVTESEAQDALNAFLRNHDLDVLFASQDKTILPESKASKQLKYLMNSFFNHIKSDAPQLFSYIVEICIGHVLASTILYDKKFNNFSGHLRKLEIYLDSRFIFRLLGVEGNEYMNVYMDLTNSMLEQEAILRVFRHTADEILGIFRNCIRWINSPDYDPTRANTVLLYFINNGKTESDIHQYIASFEDKLHEYKIEIKDAPDFSKTSDCQIDESILKEKIIESYKRNLYFNEAEKQSTIERDIKSVSAIHHLRKGYLPQTMQSAEYIFVTPNSTLSYVNKKYEDEAFEGKFHIPACLTDVFIGTLVWMQSPTKWIKINEKKMLADCIAAIQPDSLFVKKMVEEAKKLKESGKVSADEFLAVSRSYFIQEMLMKETLGDPEAVNGSNIEEVIKKIRTDAAYIPEQQLMAEKIKNQDLETRIKEYEQDTNKIQIKLFTTIKRLVSRSLNLIFAISLIFLSISIIIPFLPNVSIFLRILSAIAAVVFGILSVGYGFNLKGWKDKLIDITSKKAEVFLEKRLFNSKANASES